MDTNEFFRIYDKIVPLVKDTLRANDSNIFKYNSCTIGVKKGQELIHIVKMSESQPFGDVDGIVAEIKTVVSRKQLGRKNATVYVFKKNNDYKSMTKQICFINKGEKITLESSRNFVIVGANGSGKSHLGAAIERENPNNVLRISAQRALSIPDHIDISDYESTWKKIKYGDYQHNDIRYKWGFNNKEYTTKLINDYSETLSSLLSYQHEEEHKYCNNCNATIKASGSVKEPIIRITEKVNNIWNTIFPQRQLNFGSAKVEALYNGSEYPAKYMSDGERVALYLISQCLLAPDDMIIVIDEPEIHLHRTIMTKLWDVIEQYCPNKTFIYITHDLEFAASRKDAKKLWVKSFDGKDEWNLEELPDSEEIPEDLMIEVLGNRKPILFVEGGKTSYDYMLYSQVFEDRYIIPAHNCFKVIELTKAFNNDDIKGIHHLDVKGIIDRDYLSEEEIKAYRNDGIYALEVAEVENLYLLEPVVKTVASYMQRDPDETFEKVQNFVFSEFEDEKDSQLKEICSRHISFKLHQFNKPNGNGLQDLKDSLETTVKSVDVDGIFQKYKDRVEKIINERDYMGLLGIYNRKSLPKRVSEYMGLAKNEYPNMVLRLLKSDMRENLIEAFSLLNKLF